MNRVLTLILLLVAAIGIPFGCKLIADVTATTSPPPMIDGLATKFPPTELLFEKTESAKRDMRPRITNVNIVDLDADGTNEVLVCDEVRNTIWLKRLQPDGTWDQRALVPENSIATPAHTSIVDLDDDGDTDILVAVLRNVWPTYDPVGQVAVLLNDGEFNFTPKILAENIRRVTDVQPADFDQDGDIDLVVAEFGYLHGRIFWLENVGNMQFADHELQTLPGGIHVPVGDFDKDGDIDIAAVISQNDEEVWIFENQGGESFEPIARRIWGTTNFDRGLSGMIANDLDQDGDTDFLLTAGDNLELSYPCPQPTHGCIWLENRGGLEFQPHEIGQLAGTYAAAVADLDRDGDQDVVLGSMFNEWKEDSATSLAWLENDGEQNFSAWQIDTKPTRLCTVSCGDLNADGRPDIVAGSLQIYPPFETNASGFTVWINAEQQP